MRHQEILNPDGSSRLPLAVLQSGKNFRSQLAVFALLLVSGALLTARADDQIRAVRLSNVVGSVQLVNGPDSQFSQAYPNMPLVQGSTLKTGEDGRAEIQLEDGSVARLTPNSSVSMSVLGRTSDGTNTEVELLTGLTYVEMTGTANARFVVHFGPNEVISPAPAKFRVNLDANPVELAMLDGSAHLSNGSIYSVDVKMNEAVHFDASDSSRYFLAQGVDGDSWDQWNIDRDQAANQMAAQQTREAVGSGNSDSSFSDLDYYGNWYSSGNGSNYWVPDGAGAGWDPYGLGSWGYYGGSGGYVWISGYPWGWAPYHCGTWNYYNTAWGWSPIGCGRGFYPTSGIGRAPTHYRPIPRPTLHLTPGATHAAVRSNLIAVDRGPEATTLAPRTGEAPKSIATEGGTSHLLAKTPNASMAFAGHAGSPGATALRPGYTGNAAYGNVPVYRTPAQGSSYRPTTPAGSYSSARTSGGQAAAPHYSAPAASAPSSGGHASAPAGGGGHVR